MMELIITKKGIKEIFNNHFVMCFANNSIAHRTKKKKIN